MPGLSFILLMHPPGTSPFLFLNATRFVVVGYLAKNSSHSALLFPCECACLVPPRSGKSRKFVCCLWDFNAGFLNNSFSNVCCSFLQVQVSRTMVIKIAFLSKESPIGFGTFPPRGGMMALPMYSLWILKNDRPPGVYLKLSIQSNWLELVMQQTIQWM